MDSKKITYLDDYLDNKLDNETINKYYQKIRIYKNFYPRYLCIVGKVSYEYELHKWIDENDPKYLSHKNAKERIYIGKKIALQKIKIEGYLYGFEELDKSEQIDLDLTFNTDPTTEIKKIYALHDYGGYYGFFRPDLNEVIHLLALQIPVTDLDKYEHIYVTTEAHPSDKISEAYDNEKDKHRACTTVCLVPKAIEHIAKKQKIKD